MNKEIPFGLDQIEDNISDLKEKLRKDTSPLYQQLYSKAFKVEPAWQMAPASMMIVKEMCENFITSFVNHNIQNTIPDKLIHDGSWKESEEKITDVIKEVLILLKDIWINLVFNSELVKSLNEGTYQSTVILLSIRAILKTLPFRLFSFISTSE
ncbi:hypothetical protein C1645_825758 [Glomus cerebriforme]|uniref:Uncharacterized protein n=1 Tax=Glomus cerebriforme TaxID=658196 RepID=A0A397SRS2_9GLOM|nr:hypothetical protein C1645_825758 [Glomus cerebriforme]